MGVPDKITEVNKDTFWTLIAQAKEHTGGPGEWLREQLMDMGPEQAKIFDTMARVYMDLAYQYGLWTAASVMENHGCSDDGFIDFRAWLVGQGKDVYMAALKDPDSLADVQDYQASQFDSLPYMGDLAYEELTGRSTFEDFDPEQYHALEAEVKPDIVYGDGVGYPYTWSETAAYLPKLCAKYMEPEELAWLVREHIDTWNVTSPDIQAARRTVQKSKKTIGINATPDGQEHFGNPEQDIRALTAALREFCPSLENTQDMKRFYDAVSRDLDAGGFKLYHAAVKITGIKVFERFPYEDNMGYFEEMDGHRLLNYLTASYCGAVEWKIVPGTIYEKAILHEPDTASRKYQDFLKKLYAQVLADMGFQDYISADLIRTPEHGPIQKPAKGSHPRVPRHSQRRDNTR